jgi:putative glutamine amidotransferase
MWGFAKMIQRLLVLATLLVGVAAQAANGGSLIVWQPTAGSARLILYRTNQQTPQQAVENFLKTFNSNSELRKLADGHLRLQIGNATDLDSAELGEVPFVVQVSDSSQMTGAPRGKNWFKMLENFGADVYLLPPAADIALTKKQAVHFRQAVANTFSGFLSLGGADIDPKLYGETNRHAEEVSPHRDLSEFEMLKTYLKTEKGAAFGICRGMQMISVVLGYKLYQDIPSEVPNANEHIDHTWDDHYMRLTHARPSYLRKTFPGKEKILVNSAHHQAVDLNSNPHGPLVIIGMEVTPSGHTPIVEAVQFKNGRGFAVQFHPERMNNVVGHGVMQMMVDVAKKFSNTRDNSCRSALTGRRAS